MNKTLRTLFALFLLAPASVSAQAYFVIDSTSLTDGGDLPRAAMGLACNGENISPNLSWSGAPRGTRSFAVSVYNPDAGTDENPGMIHWAVLNIPPTTYSLPQDSGSGKNKALPGIASTIPNSKGDKSYTGPCPAPGKSQTYEFTVYALPDVQAFYPLSAIGRPTVQWLRDRALAKATLTVKSPGK